jgi:hypothetical protein
VVFTIPKLLRGIFRKRRQLLSLLFQSAIDTLNESFRLQLDLPEGKLGAISADNHGGRKRLAEYLLRQPFSQQKITWNATSKTVIYRSIVPSQHQTQFRNFQGS